MNEAVKRTLTNLHTGDPILNEDLKLTINKLKEVVDFFEGINFRKYDLVENDLRNDLRNLQSFFEFRAIHPSYYVS